VAFPYRQSSRRWRGARPADPERTEELRGKSRQRLRAPKATKLEPAKKGPMTTGHGPLRDIKAAIGTAGGVQSELAAEFMGIRAQVDRDEAQRTLTPT
jgi:hypothetical protein